MNNVNDEPMQIIKEFLPTVLISKNMIITYEAHAAVQIEYKDEKFKISLCYVDGKRINCKYIKDVYDYLGIYNSFKDDIKKIKRIEMNLNLNTTKLYGEPYYHELNYYNEKQKTVYWKQCLMIDSFNC